MCFNFYTSDFFTCPLEDKNCLRMDLGKAQRMEWGR